MRTSNEYIIPSNFCRHYRSEIKTNVIPIFGKKEWITEVRLPFNLTTKDFFNDYIKSNPQRSLIFDGCTGEIKSLLKEYNFNSLLVGQEAILDLNRDHFKKKSLKELIKRGLRNGYVKELEISNQTILLLEEIKSQSSIAKLPKLQHLFCATLENYTRLFVFVDHNDQWLGLITISHKTEKIMQTELIIRRSKNPIGIMEALISEIFIILKKEGKELWSLGAVPFVVQVPFSLSMQWASNFIGRRLRFAYNYRGLFNFKNKFMPTWIDYYICYNKKLSFLQLFDLMRKSNLMSLVLKKIFLKIRFQNE